MTLKSIAQNPDIREGMTRDGDRRRHRPPRRDRDALRPPVRGHARSSACPGPFTVESLSPHRVLADGPEDQPAAETDARRSTPAASSTSILDNLRRAGVQNTKRGERLEFTRLDPYPGVYVQGVGEYTEAGADARPSRSRIGPEFGTVGPELIRDAAKEAVKVADLLVVCGFAFDPLAGEEATHARPPDRSSRRA